MLSARDIPLPRKAHALVTERTPTLVRQRPQFEHMSFAGKAWGHGPVMGLGDSAAAADAANSTIGARGRSRRDAMVGRAAVRA
eukprot:5341098-Pleurochrysis_carterae.AAC.2